MTSVARMDLKPSLATYRESWPARRRRPGTALRFFLPIAVAGLLLGFARSGANGELLAIVALVTVGLGGLAFGIDRLYLAFIHIIVGEGEIQEKGLPFFTRRARVSRLRAVVRCSIDYRFGVAVPAWVVIDQFGKAQFWLSGELWSAEDMGSLATALGGHVEGRFGDVVTKDELSSHFPGPMKRW